MSRLTLPLGAHGRAMDESSTIQHTLVLRRFEPEQNVARFYALMIERDLFGRIVLVCHWGRVGSRGRERLDALTGMTSPVHCGWAASTGLTRFAYLTRAHQDGP